MNTYLEQFLELFGRAGTGFLSMIFAVLVVIRIQNTPSLSTTDALLGLAVAMLFVIMGCVVDLWKNELIFKGD